MLRINTLSDTEAYDTHASYQNFKRLAEPKEELGAETPKQEGSKVIDNPLALNVCSDNVMTLMLQIYLELCEIMNMRMKFH